MRKPNFASIVLLALVSLLAPRLSAQSAPLIEALGGLQWGMNAASSIEVFGESYLDEYRTSIAGVNDPMEIDRLRQAADRKVNEIANSLESFDEVTTAYDVSIIGGEVRGGAGQTMVTVREQVLTRYLLFTNDRLTKVAVVYALDDVGYIGFEGFIERLSELYGRPTSSEWAEDDIGVRMLARAIWNDGSTRMRVEDRSAMFAGYVLVFTDATLEDVVVDVAALRTATRPSGGRNLSDMVRRIGDTPTTSRPGSDDIIDRLTGTDTTVELEVLEAEPLAGEGSGEGDEAASALDDEDELEDGERRARPRPSTPTTETEEEDEGVTIY